ncbi:autophagy protein Atg27 [Aspergillus eucalypticola CBS 122712]|uniref:Autophagy-related protein 27 n=1 Tax=Aspergillus eucalypticola (strain CBS 122712 / IBT 29274) TaxID=1448314 RepID=A0A317WGK0_ASPEC|nr:autophagy protein Atg27 [Aspergillus eucalypticola CBS 122712]PWY84168.1 autophagy protein Atg27 [Aspergillus eucalypticola CBS 122712]
MRIPTGLSTLLFSSALLPGLASASGGFDCHNIIVDSYKYDLSTLGGVHTLYHVDETEDYVVNTTYVLNICNILKGAAHRGHLKCPTSKNICGFQYKTALDSHKEESTVFPIVGLDHLGHGTKDAEITRLKKLDSELEGLLVKLAGGEYFDEEQQKKKNAGAVIEFQCDPDRSGLEGLQTTEDTEEERRRQWQLSQRADETNGDNENNDNGTIPEGGRSLQFKSFGPADDDTYVLKLNWRTRYACDNYRDEPGEKNPDGGSGDGSSHWGFFTWLIIILFLCIAAYLIFGSWLNYNRYGARGWDLLPHGDTIRDIPYLFQDWLRRVVNTLQGTGSRGGYSAV